MNSRVFFLYSWRDSDKILCGIGEIAQFSMQMYVSILGLLILLLLARQVQCVRSQHYTERRSDWRKF